MSKIRLEIDDSYDFRVIGISCHEKDYRLVWALNQHGGFQLERKDDLFLEQQDKTNNKETTSGFPFYEQIDETLYKTFQLLANRFGSKYFLSELQTIDYLFFIRGEITDDELSEIMERIHRIDFIILASELNIFKLKQKENLLFF